MNITKEDIEFVVVTGLRRTKENEGRADIPAYDPKRFNLTSLQANILGVLAEFAVYKPLALHNGWSLHEPDPSIWAAFVPTSEYKKYLGQADIAGRIEVRRANRFDSPIPIRPKDVEAGALIVQPYIPYTQEMRYGQFNVASCHIEILGWVDAAKSYGRLSTHIPDWSKDGKDRTTMIKQSWEDFPWGELA